MEKLTPPPGVKPEIIDMVNAPTADNKIYDYFELAEKIISMPIVPKVPTCFPDFDDVLDGGFQPGELAVLSGPTKNGKTTLAQTMTYFQASQNKTPSLWFTLEMSWQELTRKFMEMDWIYRDGGSPQHIPIFYPIDNRSLSLEWVEEQIKRAKEEHGVKMVFIDHLHFLIPMADSAKGNVSFLVGATVRAIKQIAVRNEITIVLIAHTKKLDVKETPDINSLRDSSFIAQESDFTIIVWRERLQPDKGANVLDYQEVYTDRTFVSVEANRRNGKTKRFALGMYRGTLRSWPEYVELSQQAFVDERVQNMGTEDDMLAMVRDQMSAPPVQTSMLDDEDVALSKAVDLAIMKFGGRVVK